MKLNKIMNLYNSKMGGKVSKARRACMTNKSTSGNITGSGVGAGITVTKSYDTSCVQNMLSK